MTGSPLKLTLGGYNVEIARRVDGGITITTHVLFSTIAVPVPAAEWAEIVEFAPPKERDPQ